MQHDCDTVDARMNLGLFVTDVMLKTGRRCFCVVEGGRFTGIVTSHDVAMIPSEQRIEKTVGEIMRPLDEWHKLLPETPLCEALERMGREDINQLPVTKDRQLVGLISRHNILEVLRTRAEFQD